MKTVYPTIEGKRIKKMSTHVAIKTEDDIQIWLLGYEMDGDIEPAEYLYNIPLDNEEDLFAIFERLEEDNRCLKAEFKRECKDMMNYESSYVPPSYESQHGKLKY